MTPVAEIFPTFVPLATVIAVPLSTLMGAGKAFEISAVCTVVVKVGIENM